MPLNNATITWPKQDNLLFQGRNGSGYQTGIIIREGGTDQSGLYLDFSPITSKGREGNCSVTIPMRPEILEALSIILQTKAQEIRKQQETLTT